MIGLLLEKSTRRQNLFLVFLKESKKTFLSLLDRSVKRGFDNILSHNLILLDGSELNREEERIKHNFKTKWRLPGPNYSDIDGKFVTEAEQVVVGTNTFDYDDYLHIRTHNFFYYAVYSLRFFRWFFKSLQSVYCPSRLL